MTIDDIQLLYEYDRWANRRVLKAASTLSVEEFTRDASGGFRSVRDILLHILGGDWIWLAYWKNPPTTSDSLSELKTQRDALFSAHAFVNVDAVESKWTEIEAEQAELVNRATNETLAKMIPFRGTQVKLMYLMQHVVNHSTYHRGQVALRMRQLGAEPLATDFHVFLMEHESATAR
jgi:uncharacterized damage-inducible protein DinB